MRQYNPTQSSTASGLTQPQTTSATQPSVALAALLMPGSGVAAFAPGSRYANTPTTTLPLTSADPTDPTAPRTRVYLQLRLAPKTTAFTTALTYTVSDTDRLDNIATKYFSDPLQFWQICDANAALRPWELTELPGAQIRIPLPSSAASLSG